MQEDIRRGSRGNAKWPPVTLLVLAICGITVISDGYDVIIYGAVVPSLLHEPGWGLTPAGVGLIGSFGLVGMLIGSTSVGTLTDTLGRRKTLIGCLAWFSVMTGLCSMATSPEMFGLLRFAASTSVSAAYCRPPAHSSVSTHIPNHATWSSRSSSAAFPWAA